MMSIASLSCAAHEQTIKSINHDFYCKTFMMGRPFGWGTNFIHGGHPGQASCPPLALITIT